MGLLNGAPGLRRSHPGVPHVWSKCAVERPTRDGVGADVGGVDLVAVVDRDHVRLHELPGAPTTEQLALRIQHQDFRDGLADEQIHAVLRVAGDAGDQSKLAQSALSATPLFVDFERELAAANNRGADHDVLLSPPTQAGIQCITQRIAQRIQGEHQQENTQTRCDHVPGRLSKITLGMLEHRAPRGAGG